MSRLPPLKAESHGGAKHREVMPGQGYGFKHRRFVINAVNEIVIFCYELAGLLLS